MGSTFSRSDPDEQCHRGGILVSAPVHLPGNGARDIDISCNGLESETAVEALEVSERDAE